MDSSTLAELQKLSDEAFHALCDELLPRISSRFHPLVPHGRNIEGKSVRGQPDSYVGNSAAACRIAIQYTVQKRSWWRKVVEDVTEARRICKDADEIVVVLPVDVDRDKPKKGIGATWYEDAKAAAAPATLVVLHGRVLTQQLDDTCQDLRLHHLQIPFSRLSWYALLDGARRSTTATVGRLASLGRYDADHYIDRTSDDRLFKLWQRSLRASRTSGHPERQILIPLVADSGIGKTSLLCRFSERGSPHAPVLLLVARDLSFADHNSLLQIVMDRLQGSLRQGARSDEEAHLAKLLEGQTPLTVVLDGLDEAHNADGMRRSIDTWLRSRLGQISVLVVSSRPEFWRKCRDAAWSAFIRNDEQGRAARPLRQEQKLADLDPMQGTQLPGNFSAEELSSAWRKAGRSDAELWQLPTDVRNELKHPFTMKSAADLLATGTPTEHLGSRTRILHLWIQNRLRAESDKDARLSERQFNECLLIVAKVAAECEGSWVSVDQLGSVPHGSVPRFDPANPPGAAIERLVAANILETHPEHPDRIRFTLEAVHDSYLAEARIESIKQDPCSAAKAFVSVPFSKAVTQLERIGDQIASERCREQFVETLATLDPPKAAVVLRPSVTEYSVPCRQSVVKGVATLLSSPFVADKALATELLGRLKCPESAKELVKHWMGSTPQRRLCPLISHAALSHGLVELVPIVFGTEWFTHDDYFVDLRPELDAAPQVFRQALASHAAQFIPSSDNSDDYRRALTVLGYLRDDRAVEAIANRTRAGAWPFFYESACLLAIGSRDAVALFSELVDRYLKAKAGLQEKEAEDAWTALVAYGCNVGHLATPDVEDMTAALILSDDRESQLIGQDLAEQIGSDRMLELRLKRWKVEGYITIRPHQFGVRLGCDKWMELWSKGPLTEEKKTLIAVASDLRDARIEDALITSLADSDLAGGAAQSLAGMGSERSCQALREVLATEGPVNEALKRCREMAFVSLARLRDPHCVKEMVAFLESDAGAQHYTGAIGLASIGTDEAEQALLQLKNQSDELLVRGLVHFGSRPCVERAVEIARRHDNGPLWLLQNCRFCFQVIHGWSRHKFRTDVDVEPLVSYVRATADMLTEGIFDNLLTLWNHVDSPFVRQLLYEWYDLRNTAADIPMKSPTGATLSSMAYGDLVDRGDSVVLREFLERSVQQGKGYRVGWILSELGVFEPGESHEALRSVFRSSIDDDSRVVLIDLLGYVGNEIDIALIEPFIPSENRLVANAAYEAKIRMTDPLRLAENW